MAIIKQRKKGVNHNVYLNRQKLPQPEQSKIYEVAKIIEAGMETH